MTQEEQQNLAVSISWPKGFSIFKNPIITFLIGISGGGGTATVAVRHHDPMLDAIRTEMHGTQAKNDDVHQQINTRIDSTDGALHNDEQYAFNQPHHRR